MQFMAGDIAGETFQNLFL